MVNQQQIVDQCVSPSADDTTAILNRLDILEKEQRLYSVKFTNLLLNNRSLKEKMNTTEKENNELYDHIYELQKTMIKNNQYSWRENRNCEY